MPFFAHPQSYQPTFLDLLNQVAHDSCAPKQAPRARHIQTFTPKFDIRETAMQYELYGDLAGVEQKDVEIEFSDRQTLTVRGRRERQTVASSTNVTATQDKVEVAEKEPEKESHKATVEDDFEEITASDSGSSHTEAASPALAPVVAEETKSEEQKKPEGRYWIAERGVGQFARSFEFQEGIDQAGVQASLKNGVLSIVVPKKAFESKKVVIN